MMSLGIRGCWGGGGGVGGQRSPASGQVIHACQSQGQSLA